MLADTIFYLYFAMLGMNTVFLAMYVLLNTYLHGTVHLVKAYLYGNGWYGMVGTDMSVPSLRFFIKLQILSI